MTCRRYYTWLTFGGPMIFTTLSNSILMLRVHALYNRNRHLLVFLVLVLIGQFATELYTTVRIHSTIKYTPLPSGLHWPGCPVWDYHADYTLIAWVPNLSTTILFFFLTLWNFIKSAQEYFHVISLRRSPRAWHVPPLLCAFVEDGTMHFFMLVVTLTIVLVLALRVQGPLALLSSPWMIAMYSVSTYRLILHLRVFAAHQQGSTPTWHQTFSIRIQLSTTDDDSPRNSSRQAEQEDERQMELRALSPPRDV
ncbi:hypothetical protein F5887DRAFT_650177 [Amanita rubescens]|nr:hypothetical protein F5887DRAFT_650177 [Amanita rubescens]